MPAKESPGAGGTAHGVSVDVLAALQNGSEDKPDNEDTQAAPTFDPVCFPILARHWPSTDARWAA